MGEMLNWSCKKCGYTKQLLGGCGMQGMNLRLIRKVFSDEELHDFLQASENKKVSTYLQRQVIGLCEECNDYVSVPVLEYALLDGQRKIVEKPCSVCGGEVKHSTEQDICPKCGSELEKRKIGLWD